MGGKSGSKIHFFFLLEPFLAYKERSLFQCKDGIFGWEDFSPGLIKKNHAEFFGYFWASLS